MLIERLALRRGPLRSALTLLRQLGGIGGHRLNQGRAVLTDRVLGHVGRGARRDHVPLVGLRILQEQPGIGAHQIIGTDDERLTRGTHAGILPAPVHRHELVDLRDRELKRQNAVDPALRPDG